ncbi:hypothetical protein ACQKGI_23715 [Peribacillus muralis]|uniref:hypothetical protein n=1 Tax=Peribacillus muralis TaxID=264697 RepID=UPI00381D80C1
MYNQNHVLTLTIVILVVIEGYLLYRFIKTPGTGLVWVFTIYGALGLYAVIFNFIE